MAFILFKCRPCWQPWPWFWWQALVLLSWLIRQLDESLKALRFENLWAKKNYLNNKKQMKILMFCQCFRRLTNEDGFRLRNIMLKMAKHPFTKSSRNILMDDENVVNIKLSHSVFSSCILINKTKLPFKRNVSVTYHATSIFLWSLGSRPRLFLNLNIDWQTDRIGKWSYLKWKWQIKILFNANR